MVHFPEILKGFQLLTPAANQAADIYSTGIIFHEILHRNGPFGGLFNVQVQR
jgi:hypothetical protein